MKKYGIPSSTAQPVEEIAESEAYQEYTVDGRVKKEQTNTGRAKSKYPEDEFVNDHTSVWGSWWNQYLGWGYACCHSNTKMSSCLGPKGKEHALQREFKAKKQRLKEELEAKAEKEEEKEAA